LTTDVEFREWNRQRVTGNDRTSNGHEKAERGQEFGTERAEEDFGIVSKMQARNVDPAAVVCHKVDRR
jgi:hypothetical protein